MNPTRQDYCQFLLVAQKNFTQTYISDHHPYFSHDAINRYLIGDDVKPCEFWNAIKSNVKPDPNGYLIFDDTVIDKSYARKIELAQKQYSGNAHRIINGIGVVNCLYVNSTTGESWIIDWRIYNPMEDNKSKLQHVKEMFDDVMGHKQLPLRVVLMDSWYATKDLMMHFDRAGKVFYCPLKANRKVDDANGSGKGSYKAVSTLTWDERQAKYGKIVKVHEFPGDKKLRLFRVVATSRTDWVATNEPEINDDNDDDSNRMTTDDADAVCAVRWKIEQYHREVKQTLGLERCQCRKAVAQKNHIGCVALAWHYLTKMAREAKTTIYALKEGLLSDYMRKQLTNPTLIMPRV